MTPPTLTTDRLTLRPATLEDFEPYAAFLASPRGAQIGGPYDRNRAWEWFTNDTAHWPLLGYGGLIVCLTETGEVIGSTSITREPDFPEPELGWMLFDARHEGHGYATEAAGALRDHAYRAGLPTVVSYVGDHNPASARVAERLGAVPDPDAPPPPNQPATVYRHPYLGARV